jgi:Protein of unknown function (DUF3843)
MKKKSLLQKMVSSKNVVLADWLSLKPYGQPVANYDVFYLKQCQEVLKILSSNDKWFQWNGVTHEQLKELSCQLVSYFEDYINEIGIWTAFVETNEALYGYPVPFYDLSEYDKTYINQEDIAFLIWHYITKYSENEYITDPEHVHITAMAEDIFDHLENIIDDSPAIDFYDNFFTIKESEDFFSFKLKMTWFTTESYLLGIDFKGKMQERQAELTEEVKKGKVEPGHFPKFAYAILESFLYQKRSSYSALNGPEWFAKVARCSEQRKQEIVDSTYWIDGKFYLKEKQKEHFVFEHLITNVRYKALISSFQGANQMYISDKTAYNMHMIRWNDVYWLSGVMFTSDMTPMSIKKYKADRFTTPWMFPDSTLQHMIETTQLMYDAFVKFFGSPMAIFNDGEELEKANIEYMDFYAKSLKTEATDTFEERNERFKEAYGKTNDRKMADFHGNSKDSVGFFFTEGVGMHTAGRVRECVQLLKAPTISKDKTASLFVDFANGYIPAICDYLLSEYGGKNIKMPVNETLDVVKHLPFFQRMNSPEEFDRPYPLITMIHDEDMVK